MGPQGDLHAPPWGLVGGSALLSSWHDMAAAQSPVSWLELKSLQASKCEAVQPAASQGQSASGAHAAGHPEVSCRNAGTQQPVIALRGR